MDILWILLGVGVGIGFLALLTAYICYRMAFYAPDRKGTDDGYNFLQGEEFDPYRPAIQEWVRQVKSMPCREFQIRSFDGLTLRGRYYEQHPGAPVELMIHGYRGDSMRDMSGGAQRAFAVGHNALIVDQRGCGRSDGNVITFGVLESEDCVCWVRNMITWFGPDVKIILTGISMGASTVLTAAGREDLPENVIGVLADCGYSSAKQIITNVIYGMKLPAKLLYPFVKLGAKLFARFDLEKDPPVEMMKKCRLPVVFFHGCDDTFVPPQMSEENYAACAGHKALHLIPNAGHGLSFLVDQPTYIRLAREFFHGAE